jgi:hypothetical protein
MEVCWAHGADSADCWIVFAAVIAVVVLIDIFRPDLTKPKSSGSEGGGGMFGGDGGHGGGDCGGDGGACH